MPIVKHRRLSVDLLHEPSALLDPQPRPPCAGGDPRERKVGDLVIVVIKPADIAVSAGEKYLLDDAAFGGSQRHILEEPPRLVAGDSMPGPPDVRGAHLGDV